MNIDPVRVNDKITPRTRAILPFHFAGRPCEMDSLCALVEQYDLTLIEDCARAIETEYKGRKVGTFGDFDCFSFYVTKSVVTGDSGMVLTRSEEHAARIPVVAAVRKRGALVQVHDPMFTDAELAGFGWEPYRLGETVDAAILQADHVEYRRLLPSDLPGVRCFFDGRHILHAAAGFEPKWLGSPIVRAVG